MVSNPAIEAWLPKAFPPGFFGSQSQRRFFRGGSCPFDRRTAFGGRQSPGLAGGGDEKKISSVEQSIMR